MRNKAESEAVLRGKRTSNEALVKNCSRNATQETVRSTSEGGGSCSCAE